MTPTCSAWSGTSARRGRIERAARAHRACDRLAQAVPATPVLLQRAGARGDNIGSITAALLRLLERGVPHPNAVRVALERAREAAGQPPPHDLASYDRMGNTDENTNDQ